jgi:periplasmic protein TonB
VVLAPYYRRFELPWEEDPESNRRFRRLVIFGLALFVLFSVILPWIPKPVVEQAVPEVPERLARLMVQERPKPPPPPPPPKPLEQEKPKEEPKPVPQEQRVEQARQKAEKRLSHVRDELADLRREFSALPDTSQLTTGRIDAQSRSDRSLIAAKAGTGSTGVAAASSSRGFGGGAGALGTHSAGAVSSSVAAIAGADKGTQNANGKGRRSQESFEEEFDRNKGALYALYTRALRARPELQGKLVLEVTVAPSGDVTACRVVSSELGDDELERKIVARVKLIHFAAGDFVPTTFTKPIEFFPG